MSLLPERVLLDEDGISVTTRRIQATGEHYPGFVIPLASVASVYEIGLGPGDAARRSTDAITFALYLVALFLNVANLAVGLSYLLAGLATLMFFALRPSLPLWKALNARRRIVEVRDSSGAIHALKTSTFESGQRTYQAIRAAISESQAAA